MKKSMMMIAALMIAAMAFAQGPKSPKVRKGPDFKAQKVTEWMKKELALTPDQEAKILAINNTTFKQLYIVKNDSSMSNESKKAKRKELRKGRYDQYKTVLTADQLVLLKQKAKEHKEAKKAKKESKGKMPKKANGSELSDDDIDDLID